MKSKENNVIASALIGVFFSCFGASAQSSRIYEIDSTQVNTLHVEANNLNFFKDNEYSGSVMDGYTLPGFWVQPSAVYYPLSNVKVQLGFHALVYDGAYKYPNFAYQDIANWKGNQYQKGAHILPFFRAQAQFDNVNLVWGDLYGGISHGLIDPLYSSELAMTADPEMGFQLLWDIPHVHLDAWIDWQTFIFRNDTHQEAFTVGLSSKLTLSEENKNTRIYIPVQLLAQHRGGEIDTITQNSVHTLMNGAVGLGWDVSSPGSIFRNLNVEGALLGYYQQAGTLWPFDSGWGAYAKVSSGLGRYFKAKLGYFYGKDFISMYGIPYFGTVSTKTPGATYDCMNTLYGSAEYTRSFGKNFRLGIFADVYQSFPGEMTLSNGEKHASKSLTAFSFGAYFKINLDFHVWTKK